jgi:hypothetical protein
LARVPAFKFGWAISIESPAAFIARWASRREDESARNWTRLPETEMEQKGFEPYKKRQKP